MDMPPIDWLKEAAQGKLEINEVNVWKALNHRAFVQVIDRLDNVVSGSPSLGQVSHFRVTERGQKLLDQAGEGGPYLTFNKSDPPLRIRLWVSAFRRWCRSCPKGLQLTFEDGQLHVLATDNKGQTANDDLHRLGSAKVPWHGS